MLESCSCINVVKQNKTSVSLKLLFNPCLLLLNSWTKPLLFSIFVVVHCVHTHNWKISSQVYRIVSTIHEGVFDLWLVLSVWCMVHKPKIVDEVIVLLFAWSKCRLVMELCVIVSKGDEYWCIWKSFRENLLSQRMSLL